MCPSKNSQSSEAERHKNCEVRLRLGEGGLKSYWDSREITWRGWNLKLWQKKGILEAEPEDWANGPHFFRGQMGISHQLSTKILCPVTQSSPG